jgi:hypothetical protein
MTTETGAESTELETTAGALGAPVSSEEDDSAYEERARKLGWVPESEFKGDNKPANFKSAKEWVEGTSPQVLKVFERLEKDFDKRLAAIEKTNKSTVTKLTAIHQAEIANLKEQKTAAVKAGNVQLVEAIDAEIDKRKDDAPLSADSKDDQTAAEDAFAKDNPWYGKNVKMTAFAQGISLSLAQSNPNMAFGDNLKGVLKAVEENFPEYFEKKPSANGHADVDGGSDNGGAPSKSDPFAKLSSAERQKAAADMKAYPKIYPTKQSWVEAYNS